ncbi:MAG: PhoU family transcriptional regulator [Sulfurospirillum sp.]|nr:PhoU family transcriptional regulator [Sulfurospirillum sp.]
MLNKYEVQHEHLQQMFNNLGIKLKEASVVCEDGLNTLDVQKLDSAREKLNGIDQNANLIDQAIVKTLALYGPEADQLRELVSFLKSTNELVRIAENIKSFAKKMKSHINNEADFASICEYATHLAHSAFLAVDFCVASLEITNKDEASELYRKTSVEESKTDDLYSILEKNIMANICKDVEKASESIEILSTMRKLERIADRATNITKLMLFARAGGVIKQF